MAEEKVPKKESEENPEEEPTFVSRRQFLVGAGAGAVVGAAATAGVMSRGGPTIVEVPVEVPAEAAENADEAVSEAPEAVDAPAADMQVASDLPPSMRAVTLNIDGTGHDLVVDVRESLWETMVTQLGLGTVNMGCDRAQCGACAILVDGLAVNGCTLLSARLGRGQEITTVNGLATGTTMDDLHPVQKAYWQEGGYQCGICTRGFIMSTYALLQKNPDPTDDDIKEALAGNICRCSEYPKIFDSVHKAAEDMRSAA